jgi:hypothetical protein
MHEILSEADRERLAAILGMLGSAYAGERSAAALQAEAFMRKRHMTWADLLAVEPPAETSPEPPQWTPPPPPPAWVPPEPAPQSAYFSPQQRYDDRFYLNLFTVISIVVVAFVLVAFFGESVR